MKVKRILCMLLSVFMIIGMSTTTLASNTASLENNQQNEEKDIYDIISTGIGTSEAYLKEKLSETHNDNGVSYGFEWSVISLLRAGKTVDLVILDEYYNSVAAIVKGWNADVKPTEAERVALALTAMKKDITDIEGVNLVNLICNSERLANGANELAYALIAIYASGKEIPDDAKWNEENIITELLKFQSTDGGFGLIDNITSDVDMTAMCVQALAPYKNDETVESAIDKALGYLIDNITEEWIYSDNLNSTAQVLLALATLEVDVTNPINGFGSDALNNIITSLERYRNTEGNGYVYGTSNLIATSQVMQAYDAYRKAHMEDLSYWDFGTDGQVYDDELTIEDPEPEQEEVGPVDIYVTIADSGNIVKDKNGEYVAQAEVTVTDTNKDGVLTVDEALYAAHEAYYDGGAEAGYSTFTGDLGLSLAILWGRGTASTAAVAGYWLNNASCWSLNDTVKEGDYLTAFNYNDTDCWSDIYSYFSENTVSVEKGNSVTLTLNAVGYDENYNTVVSPYSGAKVVLLGSNNSSQKILTTDENGNVTIDFTGASGIGSYYVMAYKDDGSIVPTVCRINVTAGNSGGNGGNNGNTSQNISVYIRVADPKGSTYLNKTSYSVKKGTSAYELLQKTGLEVEATQSIYGVYVKAIEGLAEFDEGEGSGWLYRVNGNFSDYSASSYSLSDDDYVEWLYTRDLGNDLGDNSYRGSYSVSTYRPKKEKTLDDTAKYLINTVDNPTVAQIGGEWAIIGLARGDYKVPQEYFDRYYSNLVNYIKSKDGILHSRKYTEYSRVVLALTAIGKNPHDVAGYNLIQPLLDYDKTIWQGINGPIWALIALDSGSYGTEQIRERYISYILECEKPKGGWSLLESQTDADADITAMALVALANYKCRYDVENALNRGVCLLSSMQNKDGGYFTSESAAQVLASLSALGITCTDERFVKGRNTLVDNILSFKNADGSFSHTDKSSLMATEQCYYALVAAKRLEQNKTSLFNMSGAVIKNNNTGFFSMYPDLKKWVWRHISLGTGESI